MGGRGGSSGIGMSNEKIASGLVAAGGKRWEKNGKERVYLSRAMSYELDLDAPGAPPYASRSVREITYKTVQSAYYDVKTGSLEYTKSRYEWANNHVEEEWKKLLRKIRKR